MNQIEQLAYYYLHNDKSGHDFWHVKRVANLATKLYQQDYPNSKNNNEIIIHAEGYLHDVIDEKVTEQPLFRLNKVNDKLNQYFNQNDIDEIIFTIKNMSFSKNIKNHIDLPLTGQYVQDADRLDALGAIGIGRAFVYSGHKGQAMYDPNINPQSITSKQMYRNHKTTTINHFYEKLFNLVDTMNTDAGKDIAIKRTNYMKGFVKVFKSEWNGEINN